MKPSTKPIDVKAIRLPHGLGLPLPQYHSDEAAGMDLMAAVPLTTPLRLLPGMRQLVPTGLTIEIPPGYEGQVRPRSGLALNHGVTVLNAPGTVDSDYRGEVMVLLVNLGRETFVITRGQRIAQLVFHAVERAQMIDVRAVAASRRGEAGFGSTGTSAVPEAPKAPPRVPPKVSPKVPVAARESEAAKPAPLRAPAGKPPVSAIAKNAPATPEAAVKAAATKAPATTTAKSAKPPSKAPAAVLAKPAQPVAATSRAAATSATAKKEPSPSKKSGGTKLVSMAGSKTAAPGKAGAKLSTPAASKGKSGARA